MRKGALADKDPQRLATHPGFEGMAMKHTRRDFIGYLAAGAVVGSCGPKEVITDTGGPGRSEPAKPAKVIDVHTHLFNANFLPLDGVLARWVSGTTAAIVASIIRARTDDCSSHGDALSAVQSPTQDLRRLESATDEEIIDELYRTTPPSAFMNRDVVASLSTVTSQGSADERKRLAEGEFKQAFRSAAEERPKAMFPESGGFLQFLVLMTWCEHKIWAAARDAYPDVSLFVAHMMDMENYYKPSRPRYAWPDEQVRRMLALMKASNGRMLPFVAFDPKRDDWESIAAGALDAGCAGVKFYPPNGYGAIREDGTFDKNTKALFTYCVKHDIPIFTHTTEHGFESISGYGKKFATPALWRRALSFVENGNRPFANLRLCFGHAGGEPGWFPTNGEPPPKEPPFSAGVVALCREFPNAYCEIAYLSPILNPEGRRRFQTALSKALAGSGPYPFAKKIMYGSDWHMIHQLRAHREYLPSFIEALGNPQWDSIRNDFFFRNALRWLNIGSYVERMERSRPEVLSNAAVSHLEDLRKEANANG